MLSAIVTSPRFFPSEESEPEIIVFVVHQPSSLCCRSNARIPLGYTALMQPSLPQYRTIHYQRSVLRGRPMERARASSGAIVLIATKQPSNTFCCVLPFSCKCCNEFLTDIGWVKMKGYFTLLSQPFHLWSLFIRNTARLDKNISAIRTPLHEMSIAPNPKNIRNVEPQNGQLETFRLLTSRGQSFFSIGVVPNGAYLKKSRVA